MSSSPRSSAQGKSACAHVLLRRRRTALLRSGADVMYIPRRFWQPFIELARIFYSIPVHIETGPATITHIIEETYREHPGESLITPLSCWGGATYGNPFAEEIVQHRCGHQLALDREVDRGLHFDRL